MNTSSRPKNSPAPPAIQFKTLREYVDAQPRTKTLAEIADALGIAANTLSQYLGRHRLPARDVALRLSRDFNISLEGLLDPEMAQ